MNTKYRILLVEDQKQLAENLFEYLGEQHYDLDYAADGLTALHLLAINIYDLVILDIMLPGVDGLTVCKRIRNDLKSNVLILMLTAKDTIDDKVSGFDSGADDYLIKPFELRELEIRIKALFRRGPGVDAACLTAGSLQYYPGTLKLYKQSELISELSGYGASIFECLIKNYPNFVSYSELINKVWDSSEVDLKTIRTHVYSLRKALREKLGADVIRTLHGRGYLLEPT